MISGRENYRRAIEFGSPRYLPSILGCDFDWLYEKDEAKAARIRKLQALFPDDLLGVGDCYRIPSEPVTSGGVRCIIICESLKKNPILASSATPESAIINCYALRN